MADNRTGGGTIIGGENSVQTSIIGVIESNDISSDGQRNLIFENQRTFNYDQNTAIVGSNRNLILNGPRIYTLPDSIDGWTSEFGITPTDLFTCQETVSPLYNTNGSKTFAAAASSPTFGYTTPYDNGALKAVYTTGANSLVSTTTTYLNNVAETGSCAIFVGNITVALNKYLTVSFASSNGHYVYGYTATKLRFSIFDGSTFISVTTNDFNTSALGYGVLAYGVDRLTNLGFIAYNFPSTSNVGIATSNYTIGNSTSAAANFAIGSNPSMTTIWPRIAFTNGNFSSSIQTIIARIARYFTQ